MKSLENKKIVEEDVDPEDWGDIPDIGGLLQAADLIDALAAERKELDATVRLLSKVQTKLIAELAAAKKDAERYRWLRDHKPNYFIEFRVEKIIPRGPCEPDWETVSKTRLDSTIDAAMKEQKP